MDDRVVKLRGLWQNNDTLSVSSAAGVRIADIVDPLLEDQDTLQPIDDLGYGYKQHRPGTSRTLRSKGSWIYARPPLTDDRNVHLETFVITGATTTHTITLNAAAGGIIDSWHVEKPSDSLDDQIINRYNGWTRGVQAGLGWVDPVPGELTRHLAVQGGNRFSEEGFSVLLAHGGYLTEPITRTEGGSGSTTLTASFLPIEQDPDGAASVPGVTSNHYGSSIAPVLWRDMGWTQTLTLNWKGVENLHELKTRFQIPFRIQTAFFDLERYHVVCLDAGVFAQVQSYDAIDDDVNVLSDGTVTDPNYEAEFRRYLMNDKLIWGDDEGPTTASLIPKGGGVAATGATADDLAVMVGNRISRANYPSDASAFHGLTSGNVFGWMQNRDDSDGQDEKNVVMLSHAAMLTSRFHGRSKLWTVEPGTYELQTFIATDTFTNCQTLFGSVP